MVANALIGAGASLLGGFFNRSAQRKANEKNRPVNQVKEWEAAGINPLFGISSGGFIPHQASTAIGDSIATAGGQFAEHLAGNKEQELRETQLDLENELLKKELDKLAKPVEPGHMERHGGLLPLPFTRGSDATDRSLGNPKGPLASTGTEGVPKSLSFPDTLLSGDGSDDPYLPGHLYGSADDPVGSHRTKAPDPDATLQPISLLGMTFRGTGTTTAAHMVEDNAGDLAGSAWAIPAIGDYMVGTYLENVGRPFSNWMMGVSEEIGKRPKKPKKKPKDKVEREFRPRSLF